MIYDISLPITPHTTVWPGDPTVSVYKDASIDKGDLVNLTRVEMGLHTATHMDAPVHFWAHGGGIESIPLAICMGPCTVVEVNTDVITDAQLKPLIPQNCTRLLIKTANSNQWAAGDVAFNKDFAALNSSAANLLIDRGIQLVGIDYLSIERFDAEAGNPVHNSLLGAGIVILEGLNLHNIVSSDYKLTALAINVPGADGAPVRAVLEE